MPRNSGDDPFAPKSNCEALGELLKECGVRQVTFTGWKAELIECERKLKIAIDALEACKHYMTSGSPEDVVGEVDEALAQIQAGSQDE